MRSCAIEFAAVGGTAKNQGQLMLASHARELWLYRDLFSCVVTVHVRERNERVQQRCSARRVLCSQLLHETRSATPWQLLNNRGFCRARELLAV